jgi:2-methylcitrate dehydratase PrpD
MSGTASQRIADYLVSLRFEDLPADVVEKVKDHLAYHFVQAFWGHRREDGKRAVVIARTLSDGAGSNTVIGSDLRALPMDAAFANTTLMRAMEMDDVLFPVGVHAALVLLPPALALAERDHRSGKELIVALVAGYDAIGAVCKGIQPWAAQVPRRPTIPFGPFGGAASTAKILGLDVAGTASAVGYAAHSAMGLAEEGGDWPHYYSLVARNGMMSALLARAGAVTSPTILEGRYGFYETFFGGVPEGLDDTLAALREHHAVLDATTKRYPGTGANIVAVELLRDMVREHGLDPARVANVHLTLPTERENFSGGHVRGPFKPWRAASSVYFQCAIVILDQGRTDFARYERPNEPEILDMVSRIESEFEDGHGTLRFARVRVTTTDGQVHERAGDWYTFPKIDAAAELREAGKALLPEAKLERAARLIAELEGLDDVAELMQHLRP